VIQVKEIFIINIYNKIHSLKHHLNQNFKTLT